MKAKTLSTRKLAAVTAAFCAAGGAAAAGNLVVNGDFESPDAPMNPGYICFKGVTVGAWTNSGVRDSCFIQQNTDVFAGAYTGSQFLYVNDFGEANTSAQQSITLNAGTTYQLSFEVSGFKARTNPVGLLVDFGSAHHALTAANGGGWTGFNYTYTPAANGAAVLKFTSDRNVGVNIDAVSVVALPPVPEPESWALMLAGLGAIGLVARRRA
jgi:hypothetical protein